MSVARSRQDRCASGTTAISAPGADIARYVTAGDPTATGPRIVALLTDIPGLFDVQMPDGTWRNDLTTGQLRSIVMQTPDARVEFQEA